ncbi:hypothetical protein [Nakamurella endophytica]|uniref:Integral membrane protein n=1 Tax=Nakamurella endophytica TaxID=1748367 RepID=A0A917T819_9ACTN|nr:hypothetical protein [Nakamurella endophytica]GGM14101.1 hypothetical protein GCM10011594_37630 [Nakamurella endophytica]
MTASTDTTGITEIRVHGVGGSTPEAVLRDLSPRQVAGDRTAGFYRTADDRGRHVEAYSWGGLTSRSRTRILWMLMLPFMLANLAGWMAAPHDDAPDPHRERPADPDRPAGPLQPRADRRPVTRPYFWAARAAGVAVTVTVFVAVDLLLLDVLAYQCGNQSACRSAHWWTWPLTWSGVVDHPGRRLVLAASVAVLLLASFGILAARSRSRYERVEPPTVAAGPGATGGPASTGGTEATGRTVDGPPESPAARLPGGLAHGRFWDGRVAHAQLTRLHLATGLVTVALTLASCAAATSARHGWSTATPWLMAAWVLGGGGALGVLVLLGADRSRPVATAAVLGAAAASSMCAAVFGWLQPAVTAGPWIGQTPGMRASINTAWAVTFLLLVPLLVYPALRRRPPGRARRAHRAGHVGGARRAGRAHRAHGAYRAGRTAAGRTPRFRWGGPFVVLALSVILSNTVLLAVIIAVADAHGTITWSLAETTPRQQATIDIRLYPVIQSAITLLVLGLLATAVAGAATFAAGWLRYAVVLGRRRRWFGATADRLTASVTEGYPPLPAPSGGTGIGDPGSWIADALDGGTGPGRAPGAGVRWVRTVLQWRYVARCTQRVSVLLTTMVVACVVVVAVFEYLIWSDGRTPVFATYVGVTLALLIPPGLLALLYGSWRNVRRRRVLGVLRDVGTFFPRSFHPFAPPSYTERAVPELLRRVFYLHDHGGRVVLAAHSQGSILAAAALVRRSDRDALRPEPAIGLLTFGSPLRTLYQWAFPAYFCDAVFASLATGRSGVGAVRWRNAYYLTDYIGGPVDGPGRPAVDALLPDPGARWYVYGQNPPKVRSHTGYWDDDGLWPLCDTVSRAAVPPDPGAGHGVAPPTGQAPTGHPPTGAAPTAPVDGATLPPPRRPAGSPASAAGRVRRW